jgi:hypothetical protein
MYKAGSMYSDITEADAEELNRIGALSFFAPANKEALDFVKAKAPQGETETGTETAGPGTSPKRRRRPRKTTTAAETQDPDPEDDERAAGDD